MAERMQVLLTTPSTPADRMEEITRASRGFVYLVSDTKLSVQEFLLATELADDMHACSCILLDHHRRPSMELQVHAQT